MNKKNYQKWLQYSCYIIKEWFFYINHFSLIIFYHSVWSGFELFGLTVQVYSQLVQFYARAQRIWQSPLSQWTPRQEIGLECGWRHAGKRWSWEFEDFEKESVEGWHWTIQADSWVLCHWVRELSFLPLRQRLRFFEILNTTRCAGRWRWRSV